MRRFEGRYYDGASSRSRPVEVAIYAQGELHADGDGVAVRVRLEDVSVGPRVGRSARILRLPGGAALKLPDSDELEARLAALGPHRSGLVAALEGRWWTALTAVLVTAAVLALAVRFAIPALADRVARRLPVSVDARLGQGTLQALDEGLLHPSELDEARREHLLARFAALREAAGVPRASLLFRRGGALGANALALPSGVVIVTDELVALAEDEAEIPAVLAHELGHVTHRHGLRGFLQSAGLLILLTASLGDFVSISSLAAGFPIFLVELSYSRSFEREADAYAVGLLRREGLPPAALARMLERMEESMRGGPEIPYLSTHPLGEERLRAIREAGG